MTNGQQFKDKYVDPVNTQNIVHQIFVSISYQTNKIALRSLLLMILLFVCFL